MGSKNSKESIQNNIKFEHLYTYSYYNQNEIIWGNSIKHTNYRQNYNRLKII